jgi:hypothetical protein
MVRKSTESRVASQERREERGKRKEECEKRNGKKRKASSELRVGSVGREGACRIYVLLYSIGERKARGRRLGLGVYFIPGRRMMPSTAA